MIRRLSPLLVCLTIFLSVSTASAQPYRTNEGSLYIHGRVGINFYGGDRDVNPENELAKYIENIGGSLSLEGGYAFSNRFHLGLMHVSGMYPKIDANRYQPPEFPIIDQETTSKWRHHFSLIGRAHMFPDRRVSPYGLIGANVSFGKVNDEQRTGAGPVAGAGIDVAVSDQAGLFLELTGVFTFSDLALDLADPEVEADVSDFDAFTFLGLGLRYTFKGAFTPVEILTLDCPSQIAPNEPGTFTATINDDATRPVDLEWNFGDGSTAPGLTATHSYTRPGTYTVTFTASNRGSSDTAQCVVAVIGPAEIVGISANPSALDACVPLTPVNFTANVRGSAPIEYRWDFGDGGTSTEANPSHTYENPGTYTATLTVSNQAGSDTRSLTVTVEPCFCEEVEEMNAVFFDRNSSVLTEQGRQALQENLQILLDCENVCVRIEGYASRDESNPQQLSEDRARAVMQFYAEGGVRTSRMRAIGLGAQGNLGKDGGAPQFRRVDTIPIPCIELDQPRTPGQGQQP